MIQKLLRKQALGLRHLQPLHTPCLRRGLFLPRPGKRPKKKGAAQAPRGLLFRELSLWWTRKLLPCERLGIHEAQVLDGTARKSPFPPAAKVGEARRARELTGNFKTASQKILTLMRPTPASPTAAPVVGRDVRTNSLREADPRKHGWWEWAPHSGVPHPESPTARRSIRRPP